MSEPAVEAKIEQALYPVEEAPVEEPVAEVEQAPMEEVETTDAVVEEDEQPVPQEEVEPQEEEQPEEEVETLAAVLGLADEQVDIKEDGAVLINAVVDGEQVQVPFQDIIESNQGKEFVAKRSEEIIAQKAQLEEEITTARQTAEQKLQQMQTVSQLMEKELLTEYNQHNWSELSRTNPAEYHRLREMYTQKAHRIKDLQKTLTEESQMQQQELMKQNQAKFAQVIESETEKLLAANPTWHNPQIRDKEMAQLRDFLKTSYGYSEEEINQVVDSRLVKLIQDAYKNRAPAATVKGKKVAPSFQAPAAGRVAAAANARAAKAKKAALRKSGSTSALTSVLLDRV